MKEYIINNKEIENIINYLGIEIELINDPVNAGAIKEALQVEKKYKKELENNNFGYSFHCDLKRWYDAKIEKLKTIEKLNYITVYEIINI
jgi:hypothetical protein